jgi:hypothetical protein
MTKPPGRDAPAGVSNKMFIIMREEMKNSRDWRQDGA